ncbi:7 transmembrane receptor (rhodopsin) [Mactra antiquata]
MSINSYPGYLSDKTILQNDSKEIMSSRNHSDLPYKSLYTENVAISLVEQYTVPIICLSGFVGNALSSTVFLQKSMRKKACSLYLAVRGISDNGFLLTLFAIWTSSVFELRLSKITGFCQSLIFFTYVFACISVWLVVLVTVENHIRICKPFMVNHICKSMNAKVIMITLLFCVLMCYNFPFWTMTSECEPYYDYYDFIDGMVYADSIITLLIPTIIMTVLMIAMAMTTIASCKRRRRLSTSSIKYTNPLTKVTTMLLAVTLTFIVLNFPSHIVRLRLMILYLVQGIDNIPVLDTSISVQSVTQLFYFLSLAINFVVYYSFGSKFRRTFRDLFRKKGSNRVILTDCYVRRTPYNAQSQPRSISCEDFPTPGTYNNATLQVNEYVPLRRFRSSPSL